MYDGASGLLIPSRFAGTYKVDSYWLISGTLGANSLLRGLISSVAQRLSGRSTAC